MSTDHGDFAGDFNFVEKYPGSLDEVLVHTPLLVRYPGGASNISIDAPVQLFDTMYSIFSFSFFSFFFF